MGLSRDGSVKIPQSFDPVPVYSAGPTWGYELCDLFWWQ